MTPLLIQQPVAPATAPAAPALPTAAEHAALDARIELAAKKAALQGLEAQVGGPAAPEAPAAPPLPPGRRIVVEKDGKTIVLENPTAEQLAQVGIGTPAPALPPDPRMIVSLASGALIAIVAIVWMVLHYRRGSATPAPRENAEMQARMARIENAIESVAVEVERISENQRYATRVLSEGQAPHVNVNAPEIRSSVRPHRTPA